MQVETAFIAAWDAVTAQVYGPSVLADELELAAMDADEAWQQVQNGTGLATGLHESVLQGTQLALTKGKCLHPGLPVSHILLTKRHSSVLQDTQLGLIKGNS